MDSQLYPDNAVEIIKKGGIGILPTDTMYGIVCSALLPEVVEKLYLLRKRNTKKKCIILIIGIKDLDKFNIKLDNFSHKVLSSVWPGPVSVELPVLEKEFEYLTRGEGWPPFRVPKNESLQEFLIHSGPLIAPSANIEGNAPAETLDEAKKYFPNLDFYIDAGKLEGLPSTIISI